MVNRVGVAAGAGYFTDDQDRVQVKPEVMVELWRGEVPTLAQTGHLIAGARAHLRLWEAQGSVAELERAKDPGKIDGYEGALAAALYALHEAEASVADADLRVRIHDEVNDLARAWMRAGIPSALIAEDNGLPRRHPGLSAEMSGYFVTHALWAILVLLPYDALAGREGLPHFKPYAEAALKGMLDLSGWRPHIDEDSIHTLAEITIEAVRRGSYGTSNHESWADIPVVMSLDARLRIFSKSIPGVDILNRALGSPIVNVPNEAERFTNPARFARRKGEEQTAMRTAIARMMRMGLMPFRFLGATRSPYGGLPAAKKGVANNVLDMDLAPIAIFSTLGTNQVLPYGLNMVFQKIGIGSNRHVFLRVSRLDPLEIEAIREAFPDYQMARYLYGKDLDVEELFKLRAALLARLPDATVVPGDAGGGGATTLGELRRGQGEADKRRLGSFLRAYVEDRFRQIAPSVIAAMPDHDLVELDFDFGRRVTLAELKNLATRGDGRAVSQLNQLVPVYLRKDIVQTITDEAYRIQQRDHLRSVAELRRLATEDDAIAQVMYPEFLDAFAPGFYYHQRGDEAGLISWCQPDGNPDRHQVAAEYVRQLAALIGEDEVRQVINRNHDAIREDAARLNNRRPKLQRAEKKAILAANARLATHPAVTDPTHIAMPQVVADAPAVLDSANSAQAYQTNRVEAVNQALVREAEDQLATVPQALSNLRALRTQVNGSNGTLRARFDRVVGAGPMRDTGAQAAVATAIREYRTAEEVFFTLRGGRSRAEFELLAEIDGYLHYQDPQAIAALNDAAFARLGYAADAVYDLPMAMAVLPREQFDAVLTRLADRRPQARECVAAVRSGRDALDQTIRRIEALEQQARKIGVGKKGAAKVNGMANVDKIASKFEQKYGSRQDFIEGTLSPLLQEVAGLHHQGKQPDKRLAGTLSQARQGLVAYDEAVRIKAEMRDLNGHFKREEAALAAAGTALVADPLNGRVLITEVSLSHSIMRVLLDEEFDGAAFIHLHQDTVLAGDLTALGMADEVHRRKQAYDEARRLGNTIAASQARYEYDKALCVFVARHGLKFTDTVLAMKRQTRLMGTPDASKAQAEQWALTILYGRRDALHSAQWAAGEQYKTELRTVIPEVNAFFEAEDGYDRLMAQYQVQSARGVMAMRLIDEMAMALAAGNEGFDGGRFAQAVGTALMTMGELPILEPNGVHRDALGQARRIRDALGQARQLVSERLKPVVEPFMTQVSPAYRSLLTGFLDRLVEFETHVQMFLAYDAERAAAVAAGQEMPEPVFQNREREQMFVQLFSGAEDAEQRLLRRLVIKKPATPGLEGVVLATMKRAGIKPGVRHCVAPFFSTNVRNYEPRNLGDRLMNIAAILKFTLKSGIPHVKDLVAAARLKLDMRVVDNIMLRFAAGMGDLNETILVRHPVTAVLLEHFGFSVGLEDHQGWFGDYDSAIAQARVAAGGAMATMGIRPPRVLAKGDLNVPGMQPGIDCVTIPVNPRPYDIWRSLVQAARVGSFGDMPDSYDSTVRPGRGARMVKIYPGLTMEAANEWNIFADFGGMLGVSGNSQVSPISARGFQMARMVQGMTGKSSWITASVVNGSFERFPKPDDAFNFFINTGLSKGVLARILRSGRLSAPMHNVLTTILSTGWLPRAHELGISEVEWNRFMGNFVRFLWSMAATHPENNQQNPAVVRRLEQHGYLQAASKPMSFPGQKGTAAASVVFPLLFDQDGLISTASRLDLQHEPTAIVEQIDADYEARRDAALGGWDIGLESEWSAGPEIDTYEVEADAAANHWNADGAELSLAASADAVDYDTTLAMTDSAVLLGGYASPALLGR